MGHLWFIIIFLVYFNLCKVLFSGFLSVKYCFLVGPKKKINGNFVDGKNNSNWPSSFNTALLSFSSFEIGLFSLANLILAPLLIEVTRAHHYERATTPYSCHRVFKDPSIFSLNLPRIHTSVTSHKHGLISPED